MSAAQEFNLADLFELAVDQYGDRECLVVGERRCTFRELDARANRCAHYMARRGIGAGDHVGIYALNSMEWVELMWATVKLRAVWININYRYIADELAYLFDNADLKMLFCERQFLGLAQEAATPGLMQNCVFIEDGSGTALPETVTEYEEALAQGSAERDFEARSGDDLYILYTGGTTGMPKGVVWRHEDVFFTLGGGIDAMSGERVQEPMDIIRRGLKNGPVTMLSTAPLMHGACQWGVINSAYEGRKILLMRKFDAEEVWRAVEREKVNGIMITGDAMGRPMIEAYAANPGAFDCSSLFMVTSTAAIFSASVKEQFLQHFPELLIIDGVGASEFGSSGMMTVNKEQVQSELSISPNSDTLVVDENFDPLPPGSDKIGKIARRGNLPLGYYKDEKKSAEVFVTAADGTRYSVPGDFARIEEDGRITLLGRGNTCINSGGMKIFPEEVEQALKSHADVFDAVVVGAPDERWGEQVAAVVEARPGCQPELQSLQEHCRVHIAGFKIPRQLHLVARILRSPSGKPDYPWARQLVTGPGEASTADAAKTFSRGEGRGN